MRHCNWPSFGLLFFRLSNNLAQLSEAVYAKGQATREPGAILCRHWIFDTRDVCRLSFGCLPPIGLLRIKGRWVRFSASKAVVFLLDEGKAAMRAALCLGR